MNIHQELLDKFGAEHQKLKCIEELSELIQAIAKGSNIAEEIADVNILLKQMKILYPQWLTWHAIKLKRIEEEIL
jgi:NTP pyrophosphatase (non-canonical NTP hydrolase)